MKLWSTIIMISCVLFAATIAWADAKAAITDYQAIFIPGVDRQNHQQIAIRSYTQHGAAYYLLVNPNTFATQTVSTTTFKAQPWQQNSPAWLQLQNTPYIQALSRYAAPPYPLANDGVTHAQHVVNGMFLTIDMCPSRKPFESEFFKTLVNVANKSQQPTPIALAMSGSWMQRHPQEFDWLIAQAKANKLQITWINHSFNHTYLRKAPRDKNFLLLPGTNLKNEVLDTEKLLLAKNQLPSVFFRFPGLISDQKLVLELRELGLIPVGSDAWLAKGQRPKSGSIILVHGNSNEPAGIKPIMLLLQSPNIHLLPLTQAVQ